MTYLGFHLVFILPPLLVLLVAVRRAPAVLGPRAWWTIPAVALIALVWTTPWDNYLVWRGVWWYGTDRVIGTIGHVPIEEYLFFVLQPLLTGTWTYWLLMRGAPGAAVDAGRRRAHPLEQGFTLSLGATRAIGLGVYLLLAAAGALALTYTAGVYMGLILVWAAPVLAAQWLFAGPAVVRAPARFVAAVGVPTLYLWVADRIAIGLGIWTISPEYTTGLHLAGLPVEEALFFLVTNILVVQGILLFLKPGLVAMPVRVRATAGAA